MLRLRNGDVFTTGMCAYRFRPASDADITPRIIVPIRLEGVPTEAILDTGAIYLICNAKIARRIGIDRKNALDRKSLNIRGVSMSGTLHRISLEFIADEGNDCLLDVTAFVPDNEYEELPIFLGMQYCLELLRFAVAPAVGNADHSLGDFHFGYPWS